MTAAVVKKAASRFTKKAGTYTLVLQLDRDRAIRVGRLGLVAFPAGYYLYTGSAFGPGGLAARIGRHLKRDKKCRWHIDYLRKFARIDEIWYTFSPEKLECSWADIFLHTRGAVIIHSGFGSSDCCCAAHLFYFKNRPGLSAVQNSTKAPVLCQGLDV